MRSLFFSLLLFLGATPAAAQRDWRDSRTVDILLSSFEIQPKVIELRAGEAARLRFINNSTIRHSVNARDFFRSGEVRPRDSRLVSSGTLVVQPGDEREVIVVPRAGTYRARSRSLYHRALGMTAKIIVK